MRKTLSLVKAPGRISVGQLVMVFSKACKRPLNVVALDIHIKKVEALFI